MKRIAVLVLFIGALLIPSGTLSYKDSSPPQLFSSIVGQVGNYLSNKGIQLSDGELINDVATFGYLNALYRLGRNFGDLDDQIFNETMVGLKIWCWVPSMPEDKKRPYRADLLKLRGFLTRGAYDRTMASLTIVPGFVVTSVGEVFPPKQLFLLFPRSEKNEKLFNEMMRSDFNSVKLAEEIKKGQFTYKDIINLDWVHQSIN